ncbi:MAG: AMP-binding protein [Streptosporangiaceae bacterium]
MTLRLHDIAGQTVGGMFARQAAAHPDRAAMLTEGHATAWGELATAVRHLANALTGLGVHHGDRVAIVLGNCSELVHAYLAAASIGAVAVPLNPALTARELGHPLADSRVRVVILGARHVGDVQGLIDAGVVRDVTAVISVDRVDRPGDRVLEYHELVARASPHPPAVEVRPDDVAVTYYTSGTTGPPKGVLHSHFSVLATALTAGRMQRLTADDRVLLAAPLYHSAAMHTFLLAHALFGGSWAVLPGFDPRGVLESIERDRATVFFGVVPMLIALCAVPDIIRFDLSSLRVLFTGASPVPDTLKRRCVETFGPDVELIDGYGCTESGPAGTAIFTADALARPGSVGTPWPYLQAAVVDEKCRSVPSGEIGEIVLRGPTEMLGYHNQPEATAIAFAGGWLHTGDLGREDTDGFLYVTGRKKEMLIRGGVNIYPREIEEVLYAHSSVADVAVFGVPDETMGEEVMACVVTGEGATCTCEEVVRHCADSLAAYKLPRYVLHHRRQQPRPVMVELTVPRPKHLHRISAVASVSGTVASVAGLQFVIFTVVGAGLTLDVAAWLPPLVFVGGGAWVLALSAGAALLRPGTPPERAAAADVYSAIAGLLAAVGRPWAERARQELTTALNTAYDTMIGARSRAGGVTRSTAGSAHSSTTPRGSSRRPPRSSGRSDPFPTSCTERSPGWQTPSTVEGPRRSSQKLPPPHPESTRCTPAWRRSWPSPGARNSASVDQSCAARPRGNECSEYGTASRQVPTPDRSWRASASAWGSPRRCRRSCRSTGRTGCRSPSRSC